VSQQEKSFLAAARNRHVEAFAAQPALQRSSRLRVVFD